MTRKLEEDPTRSAAATSPAVDPADPEAGNKAAAVEAAAAAPEPISANKASVARAAKAREDRLAAALRTNLARRKAAARATRDGE